VHPSAVAVWIGQSANNRITHNDISDTFYTAISVGWTWGYGRSLASNNFIGFNRIHRIGQGVLSDLAEFIRWASVPAAPALAMSFGTSGRMITAAGAFTRTKAAATGISRAISFGAARAWLPIAGALFISTTEPPT